MFLAFMDGVYDLWRDINLGIHMTLRDLFCFFMHNQCKIVHLNVLIQYESCGNPVDLN